jgi:hypothetical protein
MNIFSTFFVGLIASIAFIIAQPFFGMSTLTSRHAVAYIAGGYNETVAMVLSWIVHITVSIIYAYISAIIFSMNRSILASVGQIALLGWITTMLATPANEWVVKLVNTQSIPSFDNLSAINTDIGPKFWLHILFFAFIVGGLWLVRIKNRLA